MELCAFYFVIFTIKYSNEGDCLDYINQWRLQVIMSRRYSHFILYKVHTLKSIIERKVLPAALLTKY